MKRVAVRCGLWLSFSLLFSGCMIGPDWSDDVRLAVPADAVKGKKVVVADFRKSVSATSTTGSAEIVEIKESVQVSDISGLVANGLQARGIAAEARKDFKPSYLREDEVLLSGAILTQERKVKWGNLLGAALFSGLSFTLLPTPIPFSEGRVLVYRVEITDRRGRILYQSGDQQIVGTFDSYHFYGSTAVAEAAPRRLADDLTDKLIVALQGSLASAAGTGAQGITSDVRPAAQQLGDAETRELDEAYRLLEQSEQAREQANHDAAVASAEAALGLAERTIRADNLVLERFVFNCGVQYAGRARANSWDLADMERAKPYFVRAYRIRARELGRDDEYTMKLETFMTSVFGTDLVRSAQSM